MIVFAGLMAHNPLLLQDPDYEGSVTHGGASKLAVALATTRPDVIVCISDHAHAYDVSYALFHATQFTPALKKFGLVYTGDSYPAAMGLIGRIQQFSMRHHVPVRTVASSEMDYGAATSLRLLGFDPLKTPLVLLGTAPLRSIVDHADTGHQLKDLFHGIPERVAILISGDGSHRHSVETPHGYSPESLKFDTGLISSLEHRTLAGLAKIARECTDAEECISKPLAMGYGMIRHFPVQTRILSHEVRYGIGLISAILFTE